MKSVLRAFRADKDCKIAILQYQRAEFGVGTEEHLHWSILLETEALERRTDLRCFQAVDRTYGDERGKQWELFDGKVSLVRTRKCLGGVYIGTVKESQIASMRELFAEKGWVCASIPDQATLLPSLRLASVATMAAYAQGTGAVPVVVELSGWRT
ncbi:hypothetical protein POSPLADRAFT_1057081 [Postia placenta MAD-698-R-SB12]|uniref:Uncharacterized protein n=1 Tax=Postia placenta MAD-698-R-SB12 TaxID=670580 RepID=A0A1X6N1H5_9APHY|nr:hypothetical protein POSPLADRAFT_1057081 [Postia placenta MAD-698-R-SB12]OSX62468.1 hypothetical protein POSPLADRAFT_1057081 [Postia placenta MAD-698-R-SB12]